jgi:integrase
MPHFPKPYFLRSRAVWKVQINGKQHNLGSDRDEAFRKYHALMAHRVVLPSGCVVGVIDRYLDWCKEHRSPETFEWYRWRLQMFCKSIPASLTITQLKHFHVDDLLRLRPDWSSGTKHGMARAVMRAMRWAKRKGHIDVNPVADYEKPRPGKRTVVISPELFDEIIDLAGCQQFRDLLVFTSETAARPQESLAAEARHVDLRNSRLFFPPEESKGEQWPRLVYLTDKAFAIVRRLMQQHSFGPLFRNSDGRPWSTDAVNCAFQRVQLRMGLRRLRAIQVVPKRCKPEQRKHLLKEARKLAPKYCLYHLRHSWLDRALKSGVDALTCAILMGHRDPSTLAKVYQHLSQSPDYLRGAAKKATG